MPIILVKKPFPFAPDGNHVVEVKAGEQDVSERCALVAVEHLGVAEYKDAESETDPLKMTVPRLKDWLTAKGITFDGSAKKEDLQALVPVND
jgi:hypothetical protein